jgi:fructokinase
VLHLGSLASWTPPGDLRVHAAAAALHGAGTVVISYDPNVRPDLLGEPARARLLRERCAWTAPAG